MEGKADSNTHYFKYCGFRELADVEHVLDILANNRLHAALYKEMNDPMEGVILTDEKDVHDTLCTVEKLRAKLRICSLSTEGDNADLWAHYAYGHKGCCIEVQICTEKIEGKEYKIFPVKYEAARFMKNESACDLLSRKSKNWEYEREVRVVSQNEFIPVKIISVTLGAGIPLKLRKIYQKVFEALCEKEGIVKQQTKKALIEALMEETKTK